jgi:hypothetical protein
MEEAVRRYHARFLYGGKEAQVKRNCRCSCGQSHINQIELLRPSRLDAASFRRVQR